MVLDFSEARSPLLGNLTTHRQILTLPGEPLGVTDRVAHCIDINPDNRPVNVPSYRLPHSQRKIFNELADGMLAEGIVQESHSQWNSPLFFVPIKNGSYRVAVDFRRVNEATVPLPMLQNITAFSTLDLKCDFWQIPLDENSYHITAFSTSSEQYE